MNELVKALKNFIVRDIIYIIGGASVILSFLYLCCKIDTSKQSINITIIPESANVIFYIIGIGLAYVIGYCIQEVFSLLHVVTTANYFRPRFPLRWLYRCLVGENWEDVFSDPDIPDGRQHRQEVSKRLRKADITINEKTSQDNKTYRERLTSLMMIGTVLGPCALVSGLLLLWKALPTFSEKFITSFENLPEVIFVTIAVFVIVIVFLKVFVFLIPPAFMMLIVFSKKLPFDMVLALGLILISVCLIVLGWIKGLQLMKNTEDFYNFSRNRCFREYD